MCSQLTDNTIGQWGGGCCSGRGGYKREGGTNKVAVTRKHRGENKHPSVNSFKLQQYGCTDDPAVKVKKGWLKTYAEIERGGGGGEGHGETEAG